MNAAAKQSLLGREMMPKRQKSREAIQTRQALASDALNCGILSRTVVGVALLLATTSSNAVEITEGSYEGRAQFVVKTESATYFFDPAGGGFSRMIDASSASPTRIFPSSAACSSSCC